MLGLEDYARLGLLEEPPQYGVILVVSGEGGEGGLLCLMGWLVIMRWLVFRRVGLDFGSL